MDNLKNNSIVKDISSDAGLSKDLLEGCLSNKRAGDFRFRHSKQILGCIVACLIAVFGFSTYAATDLLQKRFASMPPAESSMYKDAASMGATSEAKCSRELTQAEHERWLTLREEYYNGRFPESEIMHVKYYRDLPANTLCYVEETTVLYLPEPEMTDEELLQYIDYQEKVYYSLDELLTEASASGSNSGSDAQDKITEKYESEAPDAMAKIKSDCAAFVTEDLGLVVTDDTQYTVNKSEAIFVDPETLEPIDIDAEIYDIGFYDKSYSVNFTVDTINPVEAPEGVTYCSLDELKANAITQLKELFDFDIPAGSDCSVKYDFMNTEDGLFGSCQITFSNGLHWNFVIDVDPTDGMITNAFYSDDSIYNPSISADSAASDISSYVKIASAYVDAHAANAGNATNISYRLDYTDDGSKVMSVSVLLKYADCCYEITVGTGKTVIGYNTYPTSDSYEEIIAYSLYNEAKEQYKTYK